MVVLTGSDRRIDVGLVRLIPESESAETLKGDDPPTADDPRREDEEVFLVMTGIGVDAEVMAKTNEKVKGVLGWPAYVFAGIGRMFSRGFMVQVSSGGGDPQIQHARSVIVGNCGSLQGNVELMPDAKLDDGILDGVILAPKGAFGWGGGRGRPRQPAPSGTPADRPPHLDRDPRDDGRRRGRDPDRRRPDG